MIYDQICALRIRRKNGWWGPPYISRSRFLSWKVQSATYGPLDNIVNNFSRSRLAVSDDSLGNKRDLQLGHLGIAIAKSPAACALVDFPAGNHVGRVFQDLVPPRHLRSPFDYKFEPLQHVCYGDRGYV